jgi:hypothetical protein
MVLGKVAEAHLVAPARLPGIGGQAAHQDLQQRRLAETVGADDADALAPAQDQVHVGQHALVAVGLGQVLDGQHVPPLGRSCSKRSTGARRELPTSSSTSMRSICFSRLCAWVALVFLAPKRSTQARLRAISSSARRWWLPCARESPPCRPRRWNSCRCTA